MPFVIRSDIELGSALIPPARVRHFAFFCFDSFLTFNCLVDVVLTVTLSGMISCTVRLDVFTQTGASSFLLYPFLSHIVLT